MLNIEKKILWKDLVAECIRDQKLKCIRHEQFENENIQEVTQQLNSRSNRNNGPVCGELRSETKYVACELNQRDLMEKLYALLSKDVGEKPNVIICCFGGTDYFTMNDNLEKEFMDSIAQIAATENVWILTTGQKVGVSSVIGRSLYRRRLLKRCVIKPTVIGLTGWNLITRCPSLLLDDQPTIRTNSKLIDKIEKKVDNHHTHIVFLGNNSEDHEFSDDSRSDFVQTVRDQTRCLSVTIIIEGGLHTLDVIKNDLLAERPVIIIEGSGRLANILGTLLKKDVEPNDDEIERCLDQNKYPPLISSESYNQKDIVDRIKAVLNLEFRRYLKVFQLDSNGSLTDTIFRSLLETYPVDKNRTKLSKLAISWDCIDGARYVFEQNKDKQVLYQTTFHETLKKNRPKFVDYILREYYDPLEAMSFIHYKKTIMNGNTNTNTSISLEQPIKLDLTNDIRREYALEFIIEELYNEKEPSIKTLDDLDRHYMKMTGLYSESFYFTRNFWYESRCNFQRNPQRHSSQGWSSISQNNQEIKTLPNTYDIYKAYDQQEMFRDLFFWSVYVGYSDIAFVLLLHMQSRIGAALLASNIARNRSNETTNLDIRRKFIEQSRNYENYASECIQVCHEYNEKLACQLLLREIPLFGNVTCMQVAVAGHMQLFVNTPTFNQVLGRQWYGQLSSNTTKSWSFKIKVATALVTFGLLPLIMDYRHEDEIDVKIPIVTSNKTNSNSPETADNEIKHQGVEEISIENAFDKFSVFHHSPLVKMFYHFLVYVVFLLVFSYMMLFEMKSSDRPTHGTKIYVCITVTAMLLEDIRKYYVYYSTNMMKCWNSKRVFRRSLHIIPYILFYIGFVMHMRSNNDPTMLTYAKIILAIDLELWYIFSLRFASGVKLLGPKLIMMRHMMRDLVGFIYLIFVCITAYGVVSRALFLYNNIDFTAKSIFYEVFYRPYWFLYSIADEEKAALDYIATSNTTTSNEITEATVTHILLTFHMIFINILLLNLLIAVFNFTIQRVEGENEYHWRYQRYELIQEYFEKPMFAYPPLSLLVYIVLFIKFCKQKYSLRVFKRIATKDLDYAWTEFESAATYRYARKVVEEKCRQKSEMNDLSYPATTTTSSE